MAQARVHDVEAIAAVRAAVIAFAEQAHLCLMEVDADAQRLMLDLRTRGVPRWQQIVRRRRDELQAAKTELARRQVTFSNDAPTCIEQRKAVERASRRIEQAEQRLRRVVRWRDELEQAFINYKASVAPMSEVAGHALPMAVARLDAMLDALDAYRQARSAPPIDTTLAPPEGTP
jgi:hypothetical protein